MNANSNDRKNNSESQTEEDKSPKDARTAGRARIAQLLGQLIYKRLQKERLHDTDQKR
jgi:hypothetical protein